MARNLPQAWPVALVVVFAVALSAATPVFVDDAAYIAFARNALDAPLRPYSGLIFWFDVPQPGTHVLGPPVVMYWLAGTMALIGDAPAVLKASMLPFVALYAGTFYWAARRYARPVALPVTLLAVLSPVILPGLNLFLDVPAVGLSLAAVCLFIAAADRASRRLAIAAGVALGMAMQTKMTGVAGAGIILLYGVMFYRVRLIAYAAVPAAFIFFGWEAYVFLTEGTTQIIEALGNQQTIKPPLIKQSVGLSFYSSFGLLAAGLLPALTAGLARNVRVAQWVAAALLPAIVVIVAIPTVDFLVHHDPWQIVFSPHGCLGIAVWFIVALCAVTVFFRGDAFFGRTTLFLAGWVVVELLVFYFISPFPAARRFAGVAPALTLFAGHWVCCAMPDAGRAMRALKISVAATAAIALTLWTVLHIDARNERTAVLEAGRWFATHQAEAGHRVWFVGHWGFQYYAKELGWEPLVPGRSRIAAGDYLVVPVRGVSIPRFADPTGALVILAQIHEGIRLPVAAKVGYTGGLYPLYRTRDARVPVAIYRAVRDAVLPPPAPP